MTAAMKSAQSGAVQTEPVKTEPAKHEPLLHFTAMDTIGQWTKAIVATENAGLALLKVEMEGLSVLFGGSSADRSTEEAKEAEAKTEDGFDNMPV